MSVSPETGRETHGTPTGSGGGGAEYLSNVGRMTPIGGVYGHDHYRAFSPYLGPQHWPHVWGGCHIACS